MIYGRLQVDGFFTMAERGVRRAGLRGGVDLGIVVNLSMFGGTHF